MGYVVSQASDLWSITASSSGNGSAATVNTGRAFYAGNSSSTTLTSLDPGSKIGVFNGTSVKIPAGVGTQGGPTGILSNAPGYPTTNFASMTAGSFTFLRTNYSQPLLPFYSQAYYVVYSPGILVNP